MWGFMDTNNEGVKDKTGINLEISCSYCAAAIKVLMTRFPEGREGTSSTNYLIQGKCKTIL